jgi:hypothetical protein
MALIPGTLIKETTLQSVSSHIDKASIFKLSAERKPTDFGMLDLWANKNVKDVPMYAGLILNNDITYVDGAYTFSLPTAADMSTKILENPNKSATVGKGGEEFTLILRRGILGGYGSIVTFDKLSNAPELEVTGVKEQGDKYIYRFKIVQGSGWTEDKFVPSEFITPGSKMFKIASSRASEFGQNWDSFQFKGNSEKKYMKELATAELQVHYNLTRQAVRYSNGTTLSEIGNRTLAEMKDSVTQYMFMDSPIDPQIKTIEEYRGAGGTAKTTGSTLVYTLDDICFKILAKEDNEYMMFGKGGIVGSGDNLDQGRFAMGIYHQLDKNGTKDIYDLNTFSLDTLLNAYRKFTSGKMPVVEQGKEPIVRVRTGKGGLQLVSPLIERFAVNSLGGYQQQASPLGIIEGTARTGLGAVKPFYNRLVIPAQVEFRFEYEPSFDPIQTHEFLNPMLDRGYRLSSYSFIIDDYVMSRDNIKILRDVRDEKETTWHHVAGTEAHPFFKQSMNGYMGHNASGNASGFSMYFTKRASTPWVVDPTKLLKLVPKNPKLSNFTL